MKKIVKVKELQIGEGIPKICIPIVGNTMSEILSTAKKIKTMGTDLVEWRGDHFKNIKEWREVENTLRKLKNILQDIPLLFTLRTSKEGGNLEISTEEYYILNSNIVNSKLVDIVDIELSLDNVVIKKLINEAKKNNVYTIISKHDFEKTPDRREIIRLMCEMQDLHGDILKVAVMPRSREDVLVLLSATEEMSRIYANRPIVAISMSSLGVVSRFSGELFGSAITFGSLDEQSAPGQISIDKLKNLLEVFHEEINP